LRAFTCALVAGVPVSWSLRTTITDSVALLELVPDGGAAPAG
jgi:hypothetical protein